MSQARGISRGLRTCLVSLLVAILVPVGGVYIYSHWFGTWPNLRKMAVRVGTPPGFSLADRTETGSEVCISIIPCGSDDPKIHEAFTSELSGDQACRRLWSAVHAVADDFSPPPARAMRHPDEQDSTICLYRGDLSGFGSSAKVEASIVADRRDAFYVDANAAKEYPFRVPPAHLVALVHFLTDID